MFLPLGMMSLRHRHQVMRTIQPPLSFGFRESTPLSGMSIAAKFLHSEGLPGIVRCYDSHVSERSEENQA